jgi:hypothetical protein
MMGYSLFELAEWTMSSFFQNSGLGKHWKSRGMFL